MIGILRGGGAWPKNTTNLACLNVLNGVQSSHKSLGGGVIEVSLSPPPFGRGLCWEVLFYLGRALTLTHGFALTVCSLCPALALTWRRFFPVHSLSSAQRLKKVLCIDWFLCSEILIWLVENGQIKSSSFWCRLKIIFSRLLWLDHTGLFSLHILLSLALKALVTAWLQDWVNSSVVFLRFFKTNKNLPVQQTRTDRVTWPLVHPTHNRWDWHFSDKFNFQCPRH